jgi:2-polyprenyl-3-methyl-5-hydroxy-6-metoxy-1,4-benzoquinol methylase
LIGFRYKSLKPHLKGPEGLELGPDEGEMTQFLRNDFSHLAVVDGALELLELIPSYPNVTKVHSLFEDFWTCRLFNTIIMEHILEHVEKPPQLVRRPRQWLAPNGRMFLGVPNGNSFHRLAAVRMGLLPHQCELNARDKSLGHRRVYTHETFRKDIETAGMHVMQMGCVFFKPLSNQQIQDRWN